MRSWSWSGRSSAYGAGVCSGVASYGRALRRWLVSGVAPMTDADFDVERRALARAQSLERALGAPVSAGAPSPSAG